MPVIIVLLIVGVVIVLALLRSRIVRRVTIYEFQRGLKYRHGRFEEVLGPGQYWVLGTATTITPVDTRPTFVSLVGQDVLTGDGVPLKVSVAANYQVSNPELAINGQQNFAQALYLVLQLAVREIISGSKVDDLVENRSGFAEKLQTRAEQTVQQLGLKLISADLKDLMVSGDLKKSFAQVVKARKEGQAALERARGETAALRNLANAARMVEENPGLIQLRMLQVAGESSGSTLVVGMPPSATPLPLRNGSGRPPAIEAKKDPDEKQNE